MVNYWILLLLRSGTRKDIHSPLYSVGWGLTSSVRQENEINSIKVAKEETKLYLLTDDMIVYVKNPKEFTSLWNSQVNAVRSIYKNIAHEETHLENRDSVVV